MRKIKKRQQNVVCLCLFVIAAVVIVFGCAERQIVLTPEQENDRLYYEALNSYGQAEKEFTKKLIKYNLWCENEEYLDACAMADPYWNHANDALDAWKGIVESRKDDSAAQENYQEAMKTLKTKILMDLPNYNW